MLLFIMIGFLTGMIIPAMASRFGKIIPADPGVILLHLWHRPRFPISTNKDRVELLSHKWIKLLSFSLAWGIVMAALFGVVATHLPLEMYLYTGLFLWIIGCSMAVDQQFYLLPDFFTIPLLLFGILCAINTNILSPSDSIHGALLGYGISTFAVFLMGLFKTPELGGGDVKMITALGAWLGPYGLNYTLILSFAIFYLLSIRSKKKSGALGPSLGIAAIIVFMYLYAK